MKIAIVGYGKMGKEIERIALDRGHEVILKIDENNIDQLNPDDFKLIDVAVEFSVPQSAFSNINMLLDYSIPVVSGTTGWIDKLDQVVERCKQEQVTFFYASNFSIGVNLFFKLNKLLAAIMNNYPNYNVSVEETHHTQKLDAPSGTAVTIVKDLIEKLDTKKKWQKKKTDSDDSIGVKSFREGNVPGNHKVMYESSYDKLMIEHDAKSREGFALGAVLAAEFIKDKKGYYTMNELLKI